MNDFVTSQWSVVQLFLCRLAISAWEQRQRFRTVIGFWENSHQKNCLYSNSDWQVCLVICEAGFSAS
ncbi:MAG: hypothetical protein VKK42_06780 [Lyngbya sp.]|nr:hypothetical protein [Lyngbya sp.]